MASNGNSDYSCIVAVLLTLQCEKSFEAKASLRVERANEKEMIVTTKQPVSFSLALERTVTCDTFKIKIP